MANSFGCKLERVADAYGLGSGDAGGDALDTALLDRWQGRGGHREYGYRSLTEWFNLRLLRRVYDEHGREATGNRVESEFAALTAEDELTRLEVVDDLADDGIDADAVLTDMISWSTMRTHLTECLGETKERSGSSTGWERASIDIATDRAREKVAEAVRSLGNKHEIAGGASAEVSVDVTLACDACSTTVPLVVAMDRGYVCGTHHRLEEAV